MQLAKTKEALTPERGAVSLPGDNPTTNKLHVSKAAAGGRSREVRKPKPSLFFPDCSTGAACPRQAQTRISPANPSSPSTRATSVAGIPFGGGGGQTQSEVC